MHYATFSTGLGLVIYKSQLKITSWMYYKHITIVNYDCRVVRMMLKIVASPTIIILMTLEVSFLLIERIYSTGVTHDDRHMLIIIYL